jgi:hypothetical protein
MKLINQGFAASYTAGGGVILGGCTNRSQRCKTTI